VSERFWHIAAIRDWSSAAILAVLVFSCELPDDTGKIRKFRKILQIRTWGFVNLANLWRQCEERLSANARTQIHKHSVADFEGKRVTKWYVFEDEVTNDFEGRGLLRRLGKGWCLA